MCPAVCRTNNKQVIMYTHYLLGALGVSNPFKKYITLLQITQFQLCVFHAVVVAVGLFESTYPRMLATVQVVYHISMIYLFTQFAAKAYTAKGDKDVEGSKASGKKQK
jgi:hypothetical protein